MSNTLINFAGQLQYLFSHLTISQILDMTLVAGLIFIVFQALYQTHTLQILRGVIIVAFLGGALLLLLPLTTFSYLVRILLLAGVIAVPFLFQNEFRRILVQLGQFGRQRGKIPDFDRFKHALIQTASQLSDQSIGGLIVLEGQTIIEDIIETGVRMEAGLITPELLLTIFHPRTPLHDGAVVIRGDRLAAAGCILPVQTGDITNSKLGTRHRAGLGLSVKVTDALVIIVSEETGRISVAYNGVLHLGLSLLELENWIVRFGEQIDVSKQVRWGWLSGGGLRPSLMNAISSILLAVLAWTIITFQTNPPKQTTLQDVPLTVEGLPEGMLVTNDFPGSVNVVIQTSQDRIESFAPSSVKAFIDLTGYEAGIYAVPVVATLPDSNLGNAIAKPDVVDVILEPESSVQITPTVTILDVKNLAAGYLIGDISITPKTITVTGAASLLERVSGANIEIELNGRQSTFQQSVVPVIVDEHGVNLAGLSINPKQIFVTINIVRNILTKEVGIQPDIDRKTLDPNYEVTGIEIDPATVTLTGSAKALMELEPYLVTAPISLTGQTTGTSLPVPLIIPDGITVLNSHGESIRSVSVQIQISPATGYLVVQKNVEILNANNNFSIQLPVKSISVLLVGPQILLDEISADPGIVTVSIDPGGLAPGRYSLEPIVTLPDGIKSQAFPRVLEVVVSTK